MSWREHYYCPREPRRFCYPDGAELFDGKEGQGLDLRPPDTRQKIKSITATVTGVGKNPALAAAGWKSAGDLESCQRSESEAYLMNTATPAIRDLARRLVALEAARAEPPLACGSEAARVCEKLRQPLSKLAGVAGFRSLLSRAVAIAKAEVPSLVAVQVGVDGSLQGLERPVHDPGAGPGDQVEVAVVAQLLGLLVTFIGAPLTLRLVRDAWPDTSLPGMDDGNEDG